MIKANVLFDIKKIENILSIKLHRKKVFRKNFQVPLELTSKYA